MISLKKNSKTGKHRLKQCKPYSEKQYMVLETKQNVYLAYSKENSAELTPADPQGSEKKKPY